MRAVHRIARLERRDLRPAERGEQRPCFGRRLEERPVFLGEPARRQHADRAGEIDLALLHHQLDAGMRGVGRAKHACAFMRLVDRVFLGDEHRRQQFAAVRIDERDVIARPDRRGARRVRRQRDRYRPEQAARRAHPVADALPVGVRHEARKRREPADAEHDDVALFARADGEPRQRRRAALLGDPGLALEQQRAQADATVGADERQVHGRWHGQRAWAKRRRAMSGGAIIPKRNNIITNGDRAAEGVRHRGFTRSTDSRDSAGGWTARRSTSAPRGGRRTARRTRR